MLRSRKIKTHRPGGKDRFCNPPIKIACAVSIICTHISSSCTDKLEIRKSCLPGIQHLSPHHFISSCRSSDATTGDIQPRNATGQLGLSRSRARGPPAACAGRGARKAGRRRRGVSLSLSRRPRRAHVRCGPPREQPRGPVSRTELSAIFSPAHLVASPRLGPGRAKLLLRPRRGVCAAHARASVPCSTSTGMSTVRVPAACYSGD